MSEVHSPYLSSHLDVPARTSSQLTEVTVGFAAPQPHSRWLPSYLGNIGMISANKRLRANGRHVLFANHHPPHQQRQGWTLLRCMGHQLPPLSITMWPQLLLPLPLWKLWMLLVLLVLLMPSMAVRVVGSFMQPEPSTYTVIFQPFVLTSVILPGDVNE